MRVSGQRNKLRKRGRKTGVLNKMSTTLAREEDEGRDEEDGGDDERPPRVQVRYARTQAYSAAKHKPTGL